MWVALAAAGFFGLIVPITLLRADRSAANTALTITTLLAVGVAVAATIGGNGLPGRGPSAEPRSASSVGSSVPALACMDDLAGDAVLSACEKALFSSPESIAAAVSYAASQLEHLTSYGDVASANKNMTAELAALRRAVERDRYGLVAQVLMENYRCTPMDCPAFRLFSNRRQVMANMEAHAFDGLVGRYATSWYTAAPASAPPSATAVVDKEGLGEAVATVAGNRERWANTSVGERIGLLERVIADTLAAAPDWVADACRAKGIAPGTPAVGEEWHHLAIVVRNARLLCESLRDIVRDGHPKLPGPLASGPGGRVVAPVFPASVYDRMLFAGTRAERLEFTDPRRFVYTTIGDLAKDCRALGYDYGDPVDPDFSGPYGHLGKAQAGSSTTPVAVTAAPPPARVSDELLVCFDGVRCTHDSYAIDVFLDCEDPQPADIDAINPHYVGRLSRIGMGQQDTNGRCIAHGVRRILDATPAARALGIAPGSPCRLSLLVSALPSGRLLAVDEYAGLPGFRPRLDWSRSGWVARREAGEPASASCCHAARRESGSEQRMRPIQ